MEFALLIYLAGLVENIGIAIGVIAFLVAIGSAFVCMEKSSTYGVEPDYSVQIKWLKIAGVLFVFSVFFPSQKTLHTMLVAYGAQTVAATEAAGEIGGKSVQAINKLLDEYLEEGVKAE